MKILVVHQINNWQVTYLTIWMMIVLTSLYLCLIPKQWACSNFLNQNNVATAKFRQEYENRSLMNKNCDEISSIFDNKIKSDDSNSEEDKNSNSSNEIKFLQEEFKQDQIGTESTDNE